MSSVGVREASEVELAEGWAAAAAAVQLHAWRHAVSCWVAGWLHAVVPALLLQLLECREQCKLSVCNIVKGG